MERRIEELVRGLRGLSREHFDSGRVLERIGSLEVSPDSLRPFLFFRSDGYARNLIFRDSRFELVALCWSAGASSPVHDHGGQHCWVRIERGAIEQQDFVLERTRRDRAFVRSEGPPIVLHPGDSDERAPGSPLHQMRALTDGAISLHLYARPLDRFRVFDIDRGRWAISRTHYDTIGGKKPDAASSETQPGA